ncbi:MAG: L,D-transpeptidase family protein [Oceanicaulis sp.]
MSFLTLLKRSAACAALIAASAPAAFAQQDDTEGLEDLDARVDYDPEVMGEQDGPSGEVQEGSVAAAIRDAVEDGFLETRLADRTDGLRSAAAQTYVMRVYDPVWTNYGAEDFLDALNDAPEYGLEVAPDLVSMVEAAARTLEGEPSRREAAEADLTLSAAFMIYADARINGAIDPDTLDGVKFDRTTPEPMRRHLGHAGAGQLDHARLDPDHQGYRDLIELLEMYRRHQENGGFTQIEQTEVVNPGEEADVVETLRQRLAEEGYEVDEPRGEDGERASQREYTETVEAAVEAFQIDHGLRVDGVLGPRTIAALNTGMEAKIERIEANLERWRWLPGEMPERHIRVNPAGYEASGWQDGRAAITMDAIVGQGRRPTPMIADEIEFMVANPKWYVPENILEKDKLDEIRSDPDYIPSNDYFVVERETGEQVAHGDIDWADDDVEDRYRLVQDAGEKNALGQIKFMFPNEHAIYLHGTPADELFDERSRAFSSGCVRLERPLEMADWIVDGNGGDLSAGDIQEAVDSEETEQLPLEEPLPVYLLYFTVEPGDDGQAVFWEDIYERDAPLISAMNANPVSMNASGGA